MRHSLIVLSLALLAVAVPHRAFSQSADTSDLFLNAYMANEEGEHLESNGDTQKALQKYHYAASLLDQITRDDPTWQPIIITYRKKKVAENIARLEQQLGNQGSSPDTTAPAMDGELPQKEEGAPDLGAEQQSTPTPPAPEESAGAPQGVRDEIEELEGDLRASQKKLKTVEGENQDLAGKLTDALKQLDTSKVGEAELKGQLKQAEDAYQNSVSDHAVAGGPQKDLLDRVSQLEDALKNAEADRDAATEQAAEDARRAAKTRETSEANLKSQLEQAQNALATRAPASGNTKALSDRIAQLEQGLKDAEADRDAADEQASEDARRAANARAATGAVSKQLAAADARNKDLEAEYASSSKVASELTASKEQVESLTGKLADAQKQIVTIKTDRDQIAAQRDQALADLGKARDAEKRVNELLAENATLSEKLVEDQKTIDSIKSGSPGKDKQIADLRKQLTDAKTQLAAAQQDRDNVQSSLNDLQQEYDSTTSELAQLKANSAVNDGERKTLTDENGLLRGIVLRELKEEARRDQARRLVVSELSQLQIQSDTLLKNIEYLGQPILQLTDKERSLFKDPSIDIPEPVDSSMNISIAAPKQESPIPSPPVEQPKPGATANPTPATTAGSPGTTPTELAKNTAPESAESALESESMAHQGMNSESTPANKEPATESNGNGANAPAAESGPGVPDDMLDDAHNAKDAFERQQFREAEKIYEGMLAKAPDNVYILSNLAVVYYHNDKYKLAEEALKKAVAIAPEDTFSHCTLGIVYYQEKRYDEAINELTRALAINPKYAVAHCYLGITASQKGWQEAARKELETAIELDPNYADAYFNLAVIYTIEQPPNKELAGKYYRRAVDLGAAPDAGLEQLLNVNTDPPGGMTTDPPTVSGQPPQASSN
ncbi:MAG: tetratricopeptide repeat protein [Chthoniobacteraceae bacterium]|jgi:tetratricopeptide (TPR) repeat protein